MPIPEGREKDGTLGGKEKPHYPLRVASLGGGQQGKGAQGKRGS